MDSQKDCLNTAGNQQTNTTQIHYQDIRGSFKKRSYCTKEQRKMWTFDKDYVTRNNCGKQECCEKCYVTMKIL